MLKVCVPARRRATLIILPLLLAVLILMSLPAPAFAQSAAGGEANLVLPDLAQATFLGGTNGRTLLMWGLLVCALGLLFGFVTYTQLRNLPVHRSMLEISELIYETCKTYLITQGKFLLVLWVFIAVIISAYFGWLAPAPGKSVAVTLPIILLFSLIGIAGSYGVAWFGIRVNTFANSRTAFASLTGKAWPCNSIPLKAGMSIGMMLISIELVMMLFILLFIPGDYAGPCFIGFAIGESLGAAALRVAGGIFTKIADIGADLMKIVFKIKEDDARNPGVIADCTGDNAGDSVGPSADGFETYGVTGVALITFIIAGGERSAGSGATAGVDLRDARDDGGFLRCLLLHQRSYRQKPLRQRCQNELRSAAHLAGVADLDCFHRRHLPGVQPNHSESGRRHDAMVEAFFGDHLRHAGGRGDSRIGEGLHFHELPARAGGGDFFRGRRGFAQYFVRLGGRQLQRLLAGTGDAGVDGRLEPGSAASALARSWWRRPYSHSAWWPSGSSAWAR